MMAALKDWKFHYPKNETQTARAIAAELNLGGHITMKPHAPRAAVEYTGAPEQILAKAQSSRAVSQDFVPLARGPRPANPPTSDGVPVAGE
jgi:hypothetical protein